MPSILEALAARVAFLHARNVYRRFVGSCEDFAGTQQRALMRVLTGMRGSAFAQDNDLARVRSIADLRQAAPLRRFDDLRPYVERTMEGDTTALFSPRNRVLMYAVSSGTTSQPKYIPVTPEFLRQYRRGWNTFGLKMLSDHPKAVLRAILQSSSRYDEKRTPAGIPCGAITGLLARAQKGIVRRFYVGTPQIAELGDPTAKYYTLMRFGVERDVAFGITASPATFLRMAQTANDHSEELIRDVRDGSLSRSVVSDERLRESLARRFRPNPAVAARLESCRSRSGRLAPRDFWNLEFLACWTGGTMGHYLERLADWYGDLPVRDIGLLASEGRVSIPLNDGEPVGVLDSQSAVFEFIPVESAMSDDPATLFPRELQQGAEYAVVLSNDAGLIRYRLDDVVRVHGFVGGAPLVEFLRRAGGVCSMAGEKLTESQVVEAVRKVRHLLNLPEFDYLLVPVWGDPPYYHLVVPDVNIGKIEKFVDKYLVELNEEYESRRKSLRIGMIRSHRSEPDAFREFDLARMAARGSSPDQYKRPALLTEVNTNPYDVMKPGESADRPTQVPTG